MISIEIPGLLDRQNNENYRKDKSSNIILIFIDPEMKVLNKTGKI